MPNTLTSLHKLLNHVLHDFCRRYLQPVLSLDSGRCGERGGEGQRGANEGRSDDSTQKRENKGKRELKGPKKRSLENIKMALKCKVFKPKHQQGGEGGKDKLNIKILNIFTVL